MRKFFCYIIFAIFLSTTIIFSFSTFCLAAYPKLVSTLTIAFETIESWLIRISTPAAAVSVRYRRFYEKI